METHHGGGNDGGGAIRRVAWSPDGSRLASGDADGLVNVWEVSDAGALLGLAASLRGHPSSVTSLAWSPRYHASSRSSRVETATPPSYYLLASTSFLPQNWSQPMQSGPAALWNLSSSSVSAPQPIQLEYFRADGTFNTAAYTVKWHPTKPLFATTNREFDMGGGTWSPARSPDQQTLSSFAGTIRLWDPQQGTYSTVVHGTGYSLSVSWSSSSNVVLTCGGQRMRFWDMESPLGPRGRGGMSVTSTHRAGFSTCLFSPDGTRVFAGFFSGHVSLYSLVRDGAGRLGLVDKREILEGDTKLGSFVFQAAWAPDGLGVVAMEDNGRRFHLFGIPPPPSHSDPTADGASEDDPDAAAADVLTTEHHITVEMAKGDKAASVAVSDGCCSGSREGVLVAVPLTNSSVLLWRLSDLRSQGSEAKPFRILFEPSSRGSPDEEQQEQRGPWGAAAFSPCGTLLVSVFNGVVLRIWDVESGSVVRDLKGHEGEVRRGRSSSGSSSS